MVETKSNPFIFASFSFSSTLILILSLLDRPFYISFF